MWYSARMFWAMKAMLAAPQAWFTRNATHGDGACWPIRPLPPGFEPALATNEPGVGIVQAADALFVGTDVEGHAVAELPGVGDLVDAGCAGGALGLDLVQRPDARVAHLTGRVDERRGAAEGEARPLDEGALDRQFRCVDRPLVTHRVLEVQAGEGTQCAVRSLRAGIEARHWRDAGS